MREATSIRAATASRGTVDRAFIAGVVAIALVPLMGEYAALVGTLGVVFGSVALGFVVLTGWTGQLSLGQVLPYGLGGYAAAALANELGVPVALAIPLAAVAVAPAAAVIGIAADRLRGLDLAIGTFALALMSQFLVFGNLGRALVDETSGTASVVQLARPAFGSWELTSNRTFYLYALALGALAYAGVAALDASRTGRELRAIGDDPVRAAVTGIPVARLRALAFVVAGMTAALGGALLGSARQAVTPETFTAFESLNLLAIAVVGGLGSVRGAVLAGAFGAALPELARVDPFRFLQGRLTVVYGVALLALLVARRGGLASALHLDRRAAPKLGGTPPPRDPSPALLRIADAVVDYGATRAVDRVSVRVAPGEAVALVGPNGAGKSSVFDVATGLLVPTSGRVFLGNLDVTEHRPDQRAVLGLGRTFQAARVFGSLCVAENLLVAAHRTGRRAAPAVAGELLVRLGLTDVATSLPSDLAFGSLRALEIGLALAGRPRVLLLDEPAAGLDAAEHEALAGLLDDLRTSDGVTIVLVEHDLAFVRRVAQRLIVLDQGRVIADGGAEHIAGDPDVVEAFLGTAAVELRAPPARKRTLSRRKERARASR